MKRAEKSPLTALGVKAEPELDADVLAFDAVPTRGFPVKRFPKKPLHCAEPPPILPAQSGAGALCSVQRAARQSSGGSSPCASRADSLIMLVQTD